MSQSEASTSAKSLSLIEYLIDRICREGPITFHEWMREALYNDGAGYYMRADTQIWGRLGDLFGRRATILLSALMFMGTSICGAMPAFGWNLVMCFMMGAAAGGMLPITFTLMANAARVADWVCRS